VPDPPATARFFFFSGLTNGLVALNAFDVSGHVRGFLRRWLASLSALQTALSAHFKVFRFVCRAHSLGRLAAHVALLVAALFFAKFRYRKADFLNVLWIEHGTVGANEQADFPRQNTCFDVLDSFKNLFSKLLSTYFQRVFLT
jgi:hypothetical protein